MFSRLSSLEDGHSLSWMSITRKTQCHSKKVRYHDAYIDFLTGFYNFCSPLEAFRTDVNEETNRFETRYISNPLLLWLKVFLITFSTWKKCLCLSLLQQQFSVYLRVRLQNAFGENVGLNSGSQRKA